MKKFLAHLLLAFALVPMLALPVFSSSIPKPDYLIGPSENNENTEEVRDEILNTTIPRFINVAIGLLGIAAFIGILVSALNMLIAYGNEERVNRAKTALRYSIQGFIIVVFSYAIVAIIVAIALPKQEAPDDGEANEAPEGSWLIPSAYAVSVDDLNNLFPDQHTLIESQDDEGRVSLPSGDLVTEVVPGIVTNIIYMIGFLVFISFTVGGIMLVVGRGNEEYTKKAKDIILWSAIALALVAMGYAIIYGIATLNLENDPMTDQDDVFTTNELER